MSHTKEQLITPDVIENAMSYEAYREMIDNLLSEGKTTGDNHDDQMIQYTKMNVQRMRRLDKQITLSDRLTDTLQQVDREMIWLVLTEAWCGDAAQNIPPIAKMARQNENITLKLILRDEHTDIMDDYLTNGGRSIPKLICLDADTLEELGSWGPRPGNFQQKVMEWMNDPKLDKMAWAEKLQKWYAKDKTRTLQADFETLVKEWEQK